MERPSNSLRNLAYTVQSTEKDEKLKQDIISVLQYIQYLESISVYYYEHQEREPDYPFVYWGDTPYSD